MGCGQPHRCEVTLDAAPKANFCPDLALVMIDTKSWGLRGKYCESHPSEVHSLFYGDAPFRSTFHLGTWT